MIDNKAIASRELKSDIFIHARHSKLLIWSEMQRAGCTQRNGQLELRPDGSGLWSCVTTSGNPYPGDVWHANFVVRDRTGKALFGLGPFYSPGMSSGDARREYRWSAPFIFPADSFEAIHGAEQNCGTLPPVCVLRQAGRAEVVVEDAWQRGAMGRGLEAFA